MKGLDSLRARLVAAMLLVFALGLAAAITARPFEGSGGLLSRLDVNFIREPYQDVLVLLLFTALATAIIIVVSAWSLRGLEAASRQAGRVGPGSPDARIAAAGLPKEIRPMVGAVNAALDRMAQALESERRFVADAAHELRTPLTVLSLRLQEARLSASPDWNLLDQDVAQMSRLVAQLLDLASKDSVAPSVMSGSIETLDLCRTVREAAALILPLTDTAGRVIELDLPEHLPVRGHPGNLRDVFRNLVENALMHGSGVIRVTGRLRQGADGFHEAVLTVADEGTLLPVSNREIMFERFRKASPNTVGSGLGLAIVREVVRSHGGTAMFESGAKTAVRVSLPAAWDQGVTLGFHRAGRMDCRTAGDSDT